MFNLIHNFKAITQVVAKNDSEHALSGSLSISFAPKYQTKEFKDLFILQKS